MKKTHNSQTYKCLSDKEVEEFKKTIDFDENLLKPFPGNYQWSRLKNLVDFLKDFHQKNKRYPTQKEIDASDRDIPSVRTTQRNYGGLRNIRKAIGAPTDMRKSKHRSKLAHEINKRSKIKENEFYKKLCSLYGEVHVHKQHTFFDDTNHRSDFMVYYDKNDHSKKIIIDIFYPGDRASLGGCVNVKRKKYDKPGYRKEKLVDMMYFVNTNPNLSVDDYGFKKPISWAKVMDEDTFWNELKVL